MFSNKLIIIGASSGGPEALKKLLGKLPVLDACIVIVQHMPKFINESVRRSLAAVTEMNVRLAEDGARLQDKTIFIAPSELHTKLVNNRRLKLVPGEKINFVRPSIDITMQSVKARPDLLTVAVILTGMGKDGAKGISHIKRLGGKTIAQDKQTSVIYGMPRVAAETGDIDYVLDPQKTGEKIAELVCNPDSQLTRSNDCGTSARIAFT